MEQAMNFDLQQTVREVALSLPAATRVFEILGIDYCCGGAKSLEQACGAANLQIEQVVELPPSVRPKPGKDLLLLLTGPRLLSPTRFTTFRTHTTPTRS